MIAEAAIILALLALLRKDLRSELALLEDDEIDLDEWESEATRLLARYGAAAMLAGLDTDELTPEQERLVANQVREQLPYLDKFAQEMRDSDRAAWNDDWANRAALYAGSITPIYWEGVAAIKPDQLYVFAGPDGNESCDDCQRFKTEPHTLRWFIDNDFLPTNGCALTCGGWRCEHYPAPFNP